MASFRPAMARLFSVPARRYFSCEGPLIRLDILDGFLIYKKPMPLGPPILWLEKVAMSTSYVLISKGILPNACTH